MPVSSVGIIYEFGASAIFGAATKTYFDWKNQKQRALVVLGAFIANSIFAVMVGSHVADLFVTTLPQWSNFGKAVAYITGAVAINVMSGLVAINWKDIIVSRLKPKD